MSPRGPIVQAYVDRVARATTLEETTAIRDEVQGDMLLIQVDRLRIYDALAKRGAQLLERGGVFERAADLVLGSGRPTKTPTSTPPVDREGIPPRSSAVGELALPEDLLVPLGTPAEVRRVWELYRATAKALEDPEDLVTIEGRPFRKKSFWRKIALAYGVSVELREARAQLGSDEEGVGFWSRVTVRATSSRGRFADGVAVCSNREPTKKGATQHVVYATAYTRAANRAIADLVAAGEVSAEEVE